MRFEMLQNLAILEGCWLSEVQAGNLSYWASVNYAHGQVANAMTICLLDPVEVWIEVIRRVKL